MWIALAADLQRERLENAWLQLNTLLRREVTTGNTEYQYSLRVLYDGTYPDVRYGAVTMKKDDVWKFGTSLDPDARYPASVLANLGLRMSVDKTGTRSQVLVQEKIELIRYFSNHGELPPGNKIFK
jgi:hypothetical protein